MDWFLENLDFFVLIINFFFVVAGIATAALMLFVLKRFKKGELRECFRFFAIAVIFTVIYKLIEILDRYTDFLNYWLFLLQHIAFLVAIILVFVAGMHVINYTNPDLKTPER